MVLRLNHLFYKLLYVLLRYLHSYVHLTSNKVLLRFRLFALSHAILVAIWITVFVGMLQNHAY